MRDSIDIPPSLERAVFGVVEYLDAPSLGGLIKASNALRLECEAQESWRRLERRGHGRVHAQLGTKCSFYGEPSVEDSAGFAGAYILILAPGFLMTCNTQDSALCSVARHA